tara:strand:- start:1601 stop:2431 length:831 start_codon:yes stop_codon:yes gene_type:complete
VYYSKYIKKETGCVICGEPTTFINLGQGFTTCCSKGTCKGKYQWKDAYERRKENSKRWKENNPGPGRPKGSKNKNKYPRSEAVLRRFKNNSPPPMKKGSKHPIHVKEKMSETRTRMIKNGEVKLGSYNGYFKPKNPEKYKGDPTNIVYRSRWEAVLMRELDRNPSVIQWFSEEIAIPYRDPVTNQVRRYFPDFYVKKKNHSDGKIEEVLIEVKPEKQTKPPAVQKIGKGKKPSKSYLYEVKNWGINSAKWKAAEAYCKKKGWTWLILTEKDLGITF